jgi:hypothetical protein
VIFESLLGPSAADPDLTLRCDIMFPDGDVTTLGFVVTGSDVPRSRLDSNRGALGSVGVGGVLTIIGATDSEAGGVCGGAFVSIAWTLAVFGRSGDAVAETDCCVCLSGKIAPILDATLPRLPSDILFSFSSCNVSVRPPALRSGLDCWLDPLRPGRRASFNLPTGDGDLF